MQLFTSFEMTAGGGPTVAHSGPRPESTSSSISSPPLGKRGRIRQREKQALGFLPHSRNTLAGNFAASRTLYDNSGSSSALICATEVHLCFPLSTIFFLLFFIKQRHRRRKLHLPQCTLFSSLATSTLQPDTLHRRRSSRWHRPGVSL